MEIDENEGKVEAVIDEDEDNRLPYSEKTLQTKITDK